MHLLISVVVAYLMSGLTQIQKDLNLPASERRGWAVHPSLQNAALTGATWFVRPYVDARRATGRPRRALLAAIIGVALQMALFTVFIWGCIVVAGHVFESTVGLAISSAALVLIGTPIVSVVINIMLLPVISLFTGG